MKVRHCIIVCDSAAHTGGVSAVILAQAQGLRARGVAVSVFAACGPVDAALAAVAENVHCVQASPVARNRLAEIWNREAARALAQFLQPLDAAHTVVHIHALSMGLSPSIAGPLRAAALRFIITAHDAGWACPTGYFYHFQNRQYCELEPLSLACLVSHCDKRTRVHKAYKIVKMVVLDHVSHIKRDAAAILSPSALLTSRLRSRVPEGTPVITLPNPVHVSNQGARTQPGAALLFVGRLWEEKGIEALLQAVGQRYPLVVVGDGPLRQSLSERYPQVVFKGWLSPPDVATEMRKAIALVLPSLSLEAFGLVVAEALAQGVPVVVSDRAGAATLVQPGVNGFVVNMDRPEQMLDSCAQLMQGPRAAAMALQAHTRYWSSPMSTHAYTEGLMRVFDAIPPPTPF